MEKLSKLSMAGTQTRSNDMESLYFCNKQLHYSAYFRSQKQKKTS